MLILITLLCSLTLSQNSHAQPQTRIARGANGAEFVFNLDASHPSLGESWRDPSGMIWGDIAKNPDGSKRRMFQTLAAEYCASVGARLPTNEDLIRLRKYFGWPNSYTPQVLPNLDKNFFWANLEQVNRETLGHFISGSFGLVYFVDEAALMDLRLNVRCVVSN